MENNVEDLHKDDPIWNEAMQFVLELDATPEDETLRQKLLDWLNNGSDHQEAYQQAELIWALTGQGQLNDTRGLTDTLPETQRHYESVTPLQLVDMFAENQTEAESATALSTEIPKAGKKTGLIGSIIATAIAACIALIAIQPLFTTHDFSSNTGELKNITLSDNSTTILSTLTAIDTDFSSTARHVSMGAGEAFFRISKDPSRPFTVATDWGHITVVGTRFNVRAGLRESLVVTVEEGIVEVGELPGNQTRRLVAGDRLILADDGSVKQEQVDITQIATWRNHEIIVDNWTINELIEELERYQPGFTTQISDSLGNERISGVFYLNDPLAAMKAAVAPMGGKVRNFGPLTIVSL